ncbi:MAG: AI-2E family transporter [Lachnospiraceae bacterium]|jgi:predicted PurR-regulated permease PerM|nr:AI-2E family transporter [Lachnospiraceae bacterium]
MKEKKELIQYAAVCALILYLLCHYWDTAVRSLFIFAGVIRPLILGCVMAYILNLIMSFYERTIFTRRRLRSSASKRTASILLSFLTLLLIVALIINMIVPELKSCIELLLSRLPIAYDMVMQFLQEHPDIFSFLPAMSELQFDVQKLLEQLFAWMGSGAGASLFGYISSFVSVIFNLFVSLVFAIYLLAGKEWLGRQADRLLCTYLPDTVQKKTHYVLRTLDNCFHRFIVGQVTEALILGILCILGMLLFRFPYAVMIGILVGATALIPVLGAYIGAVVGILMIFTESPFQSLMFLIFIVVLQQLENQLIYPRVVGTSIGLPGILVFSAVMTGGSLFGVAGILLGIPLTAACYQFLKDDLRRRKH